MWLAWASLVAAIIFCPAIFTLFLKGWLNVSVRSSQSLLSKYRLLKEIYQDLSWKTFFQYLYFRTRNWTVHFFDTGKLERSRNNYTVTYYDGDTKYKICFPKKTTIRQIVEVRTDEGEDITSKFLQFMGVKHNFHGIPTSPELLGYKSLMVTYRDDSVKKFDGKDIITLRP